MEPIETNTQEGKRGRPANLSSRDLAARAKKVRSGLMLGKGRAQICAEENLTVTQYRTAIRWLAHRWENSTQAFAEFLAGEQNRMEALQARLDAVLADPTLSEVDKAMVSVRIHRLEHDIQVSILEVGLQLGQLDRDAIKVETNLHIEVSFGDEGALPWFANRKTPSDS